MQELFGPRCQEISSCWSDELGQECVIGAMRTGKGFGLVYEALFCQCCSRKHSTWDFSDRAKVGSLPKMSNPPGWVTGVLPQGPLPPVRFVIVSLTTAVWLLTPSLAARSLGPQ